MMGERLNFIDVDRLVRALPTATLESLTDGPLPDAEDASSPWNCRICSILRGPNQSPEASALQWKKVAGMLSHARCCVIYGLARAAVTGYPEP